MTDKKQDKVKGKQEKDNKYSRQIRQIAILENTIENLREQVGVSTKRQLELRDERDDVAKINSNLHANRLSLLESLVQEKLELEARIIRLDRRIKHIGFDPQTSTALFLNAPAVPEYRSSQASARDRSAETGEARFTFNKDKRHWEDEPDVPVE